MKNAVYLFLFLFVFNSYGQIRICSYKSYMTEAELRKACDNFGYSSNAEAEKVVDDILSNVGLYRNFIIKECPNIENAVAASVVSSLGYVERYIIYDKEFLARVKNVTKTDWGAVSILAHEIGHHLNGHNLISGVSNFDSELQADEFSGFVLAKMGATLDESLRAINSFGNDEESETHPKKSDRIKAISKGWNKSNKNSFAINNSDNIELFDKNQFEVDKFVKMAIEESKKGNFNLAGDYMLKAFQFSGGDNREYLFFSSSYYVNSKDYDKSLKYYLMLIKNGIETLDESKQQEIYKNTALIYSLQGKVNDAINFFEVARRENPNDISLILSEADLYLKSNDISSYKALIKEALSKNPSNVDLIYNLGVISSNANKLDEAEDYYKRALQINTNYLNANINLAELKLRKDTAFVNEMNSLGTSDYDNKRYDALKKERENNFKSVLPYLEKALDLKPDDDSIKRTLLSIYTALSMNYKYNELKSKM